MACGVAMCSSEVIAMIVQNVGFCFSRPGGFNACSSAVLFWLVCASVSFLFLSCFVVALFGFEIYLAVRTACSLFLLLAGW